MLKISKLAAIVGAALMAMMWVAPAQAQATRTWISGVGDDANPCSRTAPCKTFPGAISKTAAGGEIDCLDPGGFGGVTVTKSITLDCGGGIGGQVGSILVSGTNGITVNGNGSPIIVKVRNMTINGIQATGSGGLSGIRFIYGAGLIVEHVGIFGFGGTAGSNAGVDFEPCVSLGSGLLSKLSMLDVEVQYGTQDGILIKPSGSCSATASLDGVHSIINGGTGLKVDNTATSSGNGSIAIVTRSDFSNNAGGVAVNSSTTTAAVVITETMVADNTAVGVASNGTTVSKLFVGSSTLGGNANAIIQGGTSILSTYGNNYVNGNVASVTFPNAPIAMR